DREADRGYDPRPLKAESGAAGCRCGIAAVAPRWASLDWGAPPEHAAGTDPPGSADRSAAAAGDAALPAGASLDREAAQPEPNRCCPPEATAAGAAGRRSGWNAGAARVRAV